MRFVVNISLILYIIFPGIMGVSTGFYGTKMLINDHMPVIVDYKARFTIQYHLAAILISGLYVTFD